MRDERQRPPGREPAGQRPGRPWLAPAAALALFAAVVLATAWLSDDAYITFRVVDNAAAGYGPVWNVAERVQPYTHPLWFLLLLAGRLLTGELYYTALALSLAASLGAAALLAGAALAWRRPPAVAALAVLVLALSRAFADFSTSGLENALSHLLLAAFLVVWFGDAEDGRADGGRLFRLSLLAALLALNRSDALLLVLPALLLALWRRGWRGLGPLALGFLPLALWTALATFYYGFPFPNTAYAKLATGIPAPALAHQGALYLLNALRWDPLTPATIAAALAAAVVARRGPALAVAAGMALTLLYVVRVGGDFMSGRFLTLPLLAAVVTLVWLWPPRAPRAAVPLAAALLLALALAGHLPVWLAGNPTGDAARRDGDIADERAYYTPYTGLWAERVLQPWAEQGLELRAAGPAVVEHGNVGFLGYYAGPAVHIVDRNGLTDPLLARLPVRDPLNWRIGHFRRSVPAGYVATLRDGVNVIADADLAAYYEPLRLVTRGPLWDRARLAAIWRLNTGAYDALLPDVWP